MDNWDSQFENRLIEASRFHYFNNNKLFIKVEPATPRENLGFEDGLKETKPISENFESITAILNILTST